MPSRQVRELEAKHQVIRRLAEKGKRGRTRFISAEGCYSAVVADTPSLRVKFVAKARHAHVHVLCIHVTVHVHALVHVHCVHADAHPHCARALRLRMIAHSSSIARVWRRSRRWPIGQTTLPSTR